MRVVIIADGSGSRWGNHLGIPKHLIEVDGEAIIHRSQRLFAAAGAEVLVVASDERYATSYGRLVDARHDYGRWLDGDKFASSAHHWHERDRTIVVYGDVYFTEQAVQTITAPAADWTLYGRFGPSSITGSKHAEIFALTFHPNHHSEMLAALTHVSELARGGTIDRCGGWELYRAMNGLRGRQCRHRSPQPPLARHVAIDDWTEDFDSPSDYYAFTARRTTPTVTVAVPLNLTDDHRRQAWQYIRNQYARLGWPIVTGTCDGPWRKAQAIADAVAKAETNMVLVADADMLIPNLPAAVTALTASGRAWGKPYRILKRLTPEATTRVLAGATPTVVADDRGSLLEPPYAHVIGGGAVMLPTQLARECPGDPRFVGWGCEDAAWGWMLKSLAGAPRVENETAIHLWHPPQTRPSRSQGSPENEALKRRYSAARRDPIEMQALIREGRTP